MLEGRVAPRIVTKHRTVYRLSDGWGFSAPKDDTVTAVPAGAAATLADKGDDVEVLSEEKVGGYDTAVLRADDPKPLLAWLKRRGFESDARLEDWLRPYTQKGWAITAFRFRPNGKTYTTAPVCLSFPTDRPFYPYREPTATNAPASRSLRVFLVAPDRRAGRLATDAWPTTVEYAAPIPEDDIWPLAYALGVPGPALRGQWLTGFLDRRPVRPDSELFFDASPDQGTVEPPPVVRWEDDPVDVPKGLVAMGLVGPLALVGVLLVRRRR